MGEFKNLKKLVGTQTESTDINYIRFKGSGPVSDRDLLLVERAFVGGTSIIVCLPVAIFLFQMSMKW